ncbi:hypothetical protein [Tenacibaculum sp. M341]|uniref:hypothetical protein n=1 Tax=Tenacibaculum sp. M341 TaxID=2530339 RepID=UPI00104ED7FC|nr:hypothetical protein [Tenacibaculum sp. M341]TCI93631.1 hypothetical protein EYW44_04255 [Tenacibaculum sp. M341]
MKKNLKLIITIIFLSVSCKSFKIDNKKSNRLIIGKWNFVRATDSSGTEYTYIRGDHEYKVVTSNIEFKPDKTYIKDYGKNNITTCNWQIVNDSIFQFGGLLDSLSYDKQFEDSTQVIRKINTNKLVLEMRPNFYFHYEKEVIKRNSNMMY